MQSTDLLIGTALTITLIATLTYTDPICPHYEYSVEPRNYAASQANHSSTSHALWATQQYPLHMIGDSRFVGLHMAVGTKSHVTYTAKVGQGYQWLQQQRVITQNEPQILVLAMGINDLSNLKKYQELYGTLHTTTWKDCPMYIVSVNPVCAPCTSVTNSQIQAFNASMQQWINEKNATDSSAAYSIQYIDTYTYLQTQGFASSDGLHYSTKTNQAIYQYILSQIDEPIGDGVILHSRDSDISIASLPVGTSYQKYGESHP